VNRAGGDTASAAPGHRRGGLVWHRDFRRLWAGDAISQLGSQVSELAIPLVAVISLHASTFEVGMLNALESAAFLPGGLPAGAYCDRLRCRTGPPQATASRAGEPRRRIAVPVSGEAPPGASPAQACPAGCGWQAHSQPAN
jgi:hypothetical protein